MTRSVRRRLGLAATLVACVGCFIAAQAALATTTTVSDVVSAKFASGVQSTSPYAVFSSISCTSAGNCTAGGYYTAPGGYTDAFTETETNGTWATAEPVTFASQSSSNPGSNIDSISCSSAGNCTAVGRFQDSRNYAEAYAVTETNGTWGTAQPASFTSVPQNTDPNAELLSVSCASAGNCTAVGYFRDSSGNQQAFTQTETSGTWGTATPASFASNVQSTSPNALFRSVSCTSPGNCTAVGQFANYSGGYYQPFVETETGGSWGTATPSTFGSTSQSTAPYAVLQTVSCTSADNCTAGGYYTDTGNYREAFTQTDTAGVWTDVTPVTYPTHGSTPGDQVSSVACSSAGDCTAAGNYVNGSNSSQPFTVKETGGSWATAQPATFGTNVQSSSPDAVFKMISCTSADNCTAVGQFYDSGFNYEAFTETETNGTWGAAIPAKFAANTRGSYPSDQFDAVSCPAAGSCTAVGRFYAAGDVTQPMSEAVSTRGTITLTTKKPTRGIVHKHPYTPSATSSSGDSVRITIASTSSKVCRITSGVVAFENAGTCKVLFDDPGNLGYMPAIQRSQSIRVINHPSAPRRPRAKPHSHKALVRWSKPAKTGGARITRYIVTSFPGHHHCKTRGALHCTVKHLRNGRKYRFKIRATNAVGTGPASRYTRRVKPHS